MVCLPVLLHNFDLVYNLRAKNIQVHGMFCPQVGKDCLHLPKAFNLVTVNEIREAMPHIYPFSRPPSSARTAVRNAQEQLSGGAEASSVCGPFAGAVVLHDPIDWAAELQVAVCM